MYPADDSAASGIKNAWTWLATTMRCITMGCGCEFGGYDVHPLVPTFNRSNDDAAPRAPSAVNEETASHMNILRAMGR